MKRKKELARQQRKREKQARRRERKTDRDDLPGADSDIDPDIAHIIPGPQPLPWDDDDIEEETDE